MRSDRINRQVAGSLALDGRQGLAGMAGLRPIPTALADEKAWDRARRPKRCKLANNPRLRRAIAGKLRLNWSPEQIAGWLKRTHAEDGSSTCHTRQSIAAYSFKPVGCLRRSCWAIFDRNGRSVDRSGRVSMATDGGKSRISSQSVSGRQRLKIGRSLVIGRAICCRVEEQLHRDLGRTSHALADADEGSQ